MTSDDLSAALNMLRDAENDFIGAQGEVDRCNREIQDILHDLELQEHSYHECARLARRLVVLRRERRDAKNTVERLAPLVDWLRKETTAVNLLKQVLGNMRRVEENQRNRIYVRREGDEKGAHIIGNVKKG